MQLPRFYSRTPRGTLQGPVCGGLFSSRPAGKMLSRLKNGTYWHYMWLQKGNGLQETLETLEELSLTHSIHAYQSPSTKAVQSPCSSCHSPCFQVSLSQYSAYPEALCLQDRSVLNAGACCEDSPVPCCVEGLACELLLSWDTRFGSNEACPYSVLENLMMPVGYKLERCQSSVAGAKKCSRGMELVRELAFPNCLVRVTPGQW